MNRDRWPNFGFLALFVAVAGLFTGAFLAFNYAPTVDAAHDSVAFISEHVTLGWLLRGIHHWAGTFAIVLAGLHGCRLFWHGQYKKPRRLLWMIGVGIFLVLVGFAYTGYLLPGDERAWTGMQVGAGVAESTPVVGESAAAVMRGGDVLSSATLTRLYAVHAVLLPAALILLFAAFVVGLKKAGPARRYDDEGDAAPAWSSLRRDAWLAVGLVVLMAVLASAAPPTLGPKADATGAGSPDAKPEWFFLWVNQLLEKTEGPTFLIGGVLPGLLLGLMFGLPLLARGRQRDPAKRRFEISVASAILLGVVSLTVWSAVESAETEPDADSVAPDGDLDAQAAQVMKTFRCRSCHIIDGDPEGGDTGPPLWREASRTRPAFGSLYTREFFRLKVADPVAFWEETQMRYTPPRRKPKPEQVEVLARYFFGDE